MWQGGAEILFQKHFRVVETIFYEKAETNEGSKKNKQMNRTDFLIQEQASFRSTDNYK